MIFIFHVGDLFSFNNSLCSWFIPSIYIWHLFWYERLRWCFNIL